MPAKKGTKRKTTPKKEKEAISETKSQTQELDSSTIQLGSKSETFSSESTSESESISESELPNSLDNNPETVFWTIKGGVARRSSYEDINRRDSWDYRVLSADESIVIINLDLHDAVPLVKSVLNSIMDMPEIRYLRRIQGMLVLSLLIAIVGIVVIAKVPTAEQIAQQLVSANATNTNKKQPEKPSNLEFLQLPESKTASGSQAKEEPNPVKTK